MSDGAASGPFRVDIAADVWLSDPSRLGSGREEQLASSLADLIRAHSWEAGLEIIDPESVRVTVARSGT